MGRPVFFSRRGRPSKLGMGDLMAHIGHIDSTLINLDNALVVAPNGEDVVQISAWLNGLRAERVECVQILEEMASDSLKTLGG